MKKILVAAAVSAALGISGAQAAEDITVDVAVIGAGGQILLQGKGADG